MAESTGDQESLYEQIIRIADNAVNHVSLTRNIIQPGELINRAKSER
jgi:hypothetical protein